ncbi:hypothetical protein TrRE_jg3024 [Triparma retinervis]|uniref:LsmAD domain-containing protein n=1 Tax=Triparma retinervis TaxID=2557542 RepID=A0A9W7FEE6_9STRA|nr:hypothetical protein TrRE_jg3024 [Triparma retinervis]
MCEIGSVRISDTLGSGFETDSQIGASQRSAADLERVDNGWLDAGDGGQGLEGSVGNWDQFKANEEKFGVRTGFDENLYTTKLDKSKLGRGAEDRAKRLAKEILAGGHGGNLHMMEERGLKIEGDYDEEDLYSGVLEKGKDRKGIEAKDVGELGGKKEGGEKAGDPKDEKAPSPPAAKQPSSEEPASKPPSKKLSASAPAFKFNPNAKGWTPSGSGVSAGPSLAFQPSQ